MALQTTQVLNPPAGSLPDFPGQWQDTIGQIESELYNSDIYQQVLVGLQAKLGELAGEAQNLIQHISREAIRIALQRLTHPADGVSGSVNPATPEPTPANPGPPIPVSSQGERLQLFNRQPRQADPKNLAAERLQQRRAYLQQLGQSFQTLRQAQGITLDQLHATTRIPVHQLQALESGRIEALPETIYVQGFVRQIGNALGLEGNRLANGIPSLNSDEGLLPSWSRDQTPEITVDLRPAHLYAGYTALIAGAMGGLTWFSHQTPNPVVPETPASAATSVQTQAPPQPVKAGLNASHQVSPPELLNPTGR